MAERTGWKTKDKCRISYDPRGTQESSVNQDVRFVRRDQTVEEFDDVGYLLSIRNSNVRVPDRRHRRRLLDVTCRQFVLGSCDNVGLSLESLTCEQG